MIDRPISLITTNIYTMIRAIARSCTHCTNAGEMKSSHHSTIIPINRKP